MKKETIFQAFLTKLVFWNLWSYWGHHWDLWGWSERWFSSSLTKIPHNVGFLPGWIQHCEEFFKNISSPALWGILKYTTSKNWEKIGGGVKKVGFFHEWIQHCENFPKTFQILQYEEFQNEKRDRFSSIPHKVGFLKSLKLLMTPLRSLTLMPMMI